MTEEPAPKRSTILAIENVKRIADQLRSERNDAFALAQVQRERGDRLARVIEETIAELRGIIGAQPPEAQARLRPLIDRLDQAVVAAAR
jgi:hypothetical protein